MPRALPPSGARIRWSDILAGIKAAVQGEKAIRLFQKEICHYFGVRHAFLASSGRAALRLLLTGLRGQYPERTEVALPAYTSFSVPSAVVNAGCNVSLYDLDRTTLNPDLQSLRDSINDNTLCIVVCHLFGYPCAMDEIKKIAAYRGISVIDDAAQAMGAAYQGAYAGTLGTAGIFSLSRGKNITTVDGGIILTNDDRLAAIIQKIALPNPSVRDRIILYFKAVILSLLLHPMVYWLPQRLPFLHIGASIFNPQFPIQRLLPFQAGIGREMLRRLGEINANRRRIAKAIQERLNDVCSFVRPLAGAEPVYLRLPVVMNSKPLPEKPKLGVVRSYPLPLYAIAELQPHLVATNLRYTAAKMLADTVLTLPTHDFVTDLDIDAIMEHISDALRTR